MLIVGLYNWCAGSLGESTLIRAANAGEFDADVTTDLQQPALPTDNASHNNTAVTGWLMPLQFWLVN